MARCSTGSTWRERPVLPSDLLMSRRRGESLQPKQLPLARDMLTLARDLIDLFENHLEQRHGELEQALRLMEGDSTDYRIKRGLAHLLESHFSTFEIVSPIEPERLRRRLYRAAAPLLPTEAHTRHLLEAEAQTLSAELGRPVAPETLAESLYADLHRNRRLVTFEPPTPEALIHRYNLAQVQGVFYRATEIVIHAYRNDPGQYKLLFRYLKLFQLLATIEGDVELGYTIRIDGPASLFSQTTRYGTKLATMLPALLHVTRWKLVAHLQPRTLGGERRGPTRFELDDGCSLVSHYPPPAEYDSLLELSFADRWPGNTEWRLEREVEPVPVPGSVMIPDFRVVHPDGRSFLVEIVGYWRPEYLRKKAWQVRSAERDDLVLAISERLNLERAGVRVEDLPARVIWFKGTLTPRLILDAIDG